MAVGRVRNIQQEETGFQNFERSFEVNSRHCDQKEPADLEGQPEVFLSTC